MNSGALEELEDTKEVIRIHKSKKDRQHKDQKDKEELEDTKEVIRMHKSKKDRQHNGQKDKEELEDTKEVIRIHKSKNDRQHNGQKKKEKRTNNNLQNIHIKTNDRLKKPTKNRG